MITQTQTYSLCCILTFPARITTEAVSWVNDHINGVVKSDGYFHTDYLFNEAPPHHIDYQNVINLQNPYITTFHEPDMMTDAIHGNNFWDGSFFEEFATGVVVPDDDYVAIANHYNNGNLAGEYDNMLVDRYQKMFGVKPGDFNINEITTRTTDCLSLNENYGMNIDFQYVKISEKRIVGGYVIGNSQSGTIIHISPATTCQDEVIFRALAGHELTHAYHHYILPNFTYTWNKIYSERAAYQYSFNVYTRYGYLHKAISTMAIARSLNYWGAYPEIYASPFF